MNAQPIAPAPTASSRPLAYVSAGVLVLALAAVWQSLLAPAAAIATLIVFLLASREPPAARRKHYLALGLASLVTCYSFVQFLRTEAIAGIVQGGTRAAENTAVSRLRELLFAEDMMRKRAELDHDSDKVGSAGLIAELTGELGLRRARRLMPPLLERFSKSEPTTIGPAHLMAGYWFIVCLPVVGGGFSADPSAAVDEEAAERRFIAYAWPSAPRLGLARAISLDEHERILTAPAGPKLRMGNEHPPSCDDSLAEATRNDWKPWQNKRPRQSLPGDPAGR